MPQQVNYRVLEEELMFSLNPVEPRQEFISRLKQRLLTPASVKLEVPSRIRQLFPAIAGIFGGIILIWAFKRMVDYLSNRF